MAPTNPERPDMIARMLQKTLFTAAIALSIGISNPLAANAGQLRLGMTTWVGYGPLFLARDLGYFKEEGVDVDLKIIEEASLYMAATARGDLDGAASTVDELIKYRSKDLCFKYVLALDESHGGDGVLTQDDVKSLKDLKGKEVGLNEGSISEFWFNILLKKEGMTESDVKITNLTADDAAAAFIAGRIPAAVTWEPHLSFVREQKKGKVLIDSSTTPGSIVDVVALRCDVIEKNPKEVEGFVRAYYKAIEYLKQHPTEAYAIMAKGVGGYLEKPEDFAQSAKGVLYYDRERNIAYMGPADGSSGLSKLIGFANDFLGSTGKLKMKQDASTLVDARFIDVK
ncbi:NMT1/THI5 like domain protein [Hyphomicrobium sp. MC1]|nr:NMT1/THI5 like domain protein [Hyphomicrobium sp. MC1]